jgi:hypothetical protein
MATTTASTTASASMDGTDDAAAASASAAAVVPTTKQHLVVDPFCFRQFAEHGSSSSSSSGSTYSGTIFPMSVHDFEGIANALFETHTLMDGYAPFCKHLFVPIHPFFDNESNDNDDDDDNDDDRIPTVNVLPVLGNEHIIRTEYVARNEKEVPVLQRFIPSSLLSLKKRSDNENDDKNENDTAVVLPKAKYLDLILYSREQIQRENESMGISTSTDDNNDNDVPWGIVSIKAQIEDYELPMNPITQMRNALGKEQGGSGIPFNNIEYMKSVEYWSKYVIVTDD